MPVLCNSDEFFVTLNFILNNAYSLFASAAGGARSGARAPAGATCAFPGPGLSLGELLVNLLFASGGMATAVALFVSFEVGAIDTL